MRADPTSVDHRRLAVRALVLLAGLALPLAAAAWWLAGAPGTVGALIGTGFVALLFVAASASLAWAIDHAPAMAVAVLAAGAVTRLAIYAAVLGGLSDVTWVHPPSLALATGAATTLTLAAELVWLARTPRLFHIELDPPQFAVTTSGPASRAEPVPTTPRTEHASITPCPEHVATGSRSL